MSAVQLRVVSFGYGHGEPPPTADITIDVRDWFKDPHVSPELRQMTGLDDPVDEAVLDTPGVTEFGERLFATIEVLLQLRVRTVTVAVGCVGGRHRSVVMARMWGRWAEIEGWSVEVSHRDVDRPVLVRNAGHPRPDVDDAV